MIISLKTFSYLGSLSKLGKLVLTLILGQFLISCQSDETPIKVGILHSLTGTMAISEKSVVDATQMAIDEINKNGGLLGRQIEAVIVDGRSDWPTFAKEAERLITKDKVSVIFGGWTSASRKMMRPIIEKHNHLLFYPVQYEGLEASKNIIYTGAAPNQQISPAVKWGMDNLGKRVFLVGSDYIFPRAANKLIKTQISALGGKTVGEEYIHLGSIQTKQLLDAIVTAKPDFILNTINGDSNLSFFAELYKRAPNIPSISFSIAEDELSYLNIDQMVGHYAAWNYFQSIDTEINKKFVKNFKNTFGLHRTTNSSMEAGYLGVHLWANAVRQSNTVDATTVLVDLKGQVFSGPEGKVRVSSLNNHLWKPFYLGQIQEDGQFKIIFSKEELIRPISYPVYLPKIHWEHFLDKLYKGWDNNWAAQSVTIESDRSKQ